MLLGGWCMSRCRPLRALLEGSKRARLPVCPGESSTISAAPRPQPRTRGRAALRRNADGRTQTEAIYRRYAIVSDADLRATADKLAAIEGRETVTRTVARIGAR